MKEWSAGEMKELHLKEAEVNARLKDRTDVSVNGCEESLLDRDQRYRRTSSDVDADVVLRIPPPCASSAG